MSRTRSAPASPGADMGRVNGGRPVSILFAAFLGYNPIQSLLGGHVLATRSAVNRATLTGRSFFPHLISSPFRSGLHEAFTFAIIACLIAAAASLMRGQKYHYSTPMSRPAAGDSAPLDDTEPSATAGADAQPAIGRVAGRS